MFFFFHTISTALLSKICCILKCPSAPVPPSAPSKSFASSSSSLAHSLLKDLKIGLFSTYFSALTALLALQSTSTACPGSLFSLTSASFSASSSSLCSYLFVSVGVIGSTAIAPESQLASAVVVVVVVKSTYTHFLIYRGVTQGRLN